MAIAYIFWLGLNQYNNSKLQFQKMYLSRSPSEDLDDENRRNKDDATGHDEPADTFGPRWKYVEIASGEEGDWSELDCHEDYNSLQTAQNLIEKNLKYENKKL